MYKLFSCSKAETQRRKYVKIKIHYHCLDCRRFISGHSVKKVVVVLESYLLGGAEVGLCADVLQRAKSLKEDEQEGHKSKLAKKTVVSQMREHKF